MHFGAAPNIELTENEQKIAPTQCKFLRMMREDVEVEINPGVEQMWVYEYYNISRRSVIIMK